MRRADIEIESADGTIGTYVVRPDDDGPFQRLTAHQAR